MYTLKSLIVWLNNLIRKERSIAILSIFIIFLGTGIGIFIGYIIGRPASPLEILLKIGGIGISLPTIAGIIYFLYKSDQIEERGSLFLSHLEEELSRRLPNDPIIKTEALQEIVMELLKNKILEKAETPKSTESEK